MGGTHVKVLVSWECEPRKFKSGPKLSARQIVESVKLVMADWKYDVVSIGFPGPVLRNRPVAEPRNLGQGWVGFNCCAAFGCRVKLANDAAVQILGSYKRGTMLFPDWAPGSDRGRCSGILELGHLPFEKGT